MTQTAARKQQEQPGLTRLRSIWDRLGLIGRVPLLASAILTLLAAVWAGWLRIGWQFPPLQPALAGAHGPLMISGFFGTLISLERAVALRRTWPYIGPALSGLGGILLLLGVPGLLPPLLLNAGSLWLVLVFAVILRRHPARYIAVMAAGALAWALGNALWLAGWPVYRVVLWWAAFLILTIAGERLELGRLVRQPPFVERLFLAATAVFVGGLALSVFAPNPGVRLAALGLLGLAGWLLRYDIARKTIRQEGLPRFAAVCLLSGYAWLVAAAALALRFGAVPAGFHYDAFIHSIFLGFVFAMIFAHAPIIFPAILGLPIQFQRIFYLPLLLLHLSLLARVAGDLLLVPGLRLWGGMLNGITILVFLGLTARSILQGRRAKQANEKTSSTATEKTADLAQTGQRLQWLWRGSLAAFILAGLTGSLMRYWMMAGFPAGIQFPNVRHAHSHLMYFAWVTPALMALIAARLPTYTGRAASRGMVLTIGFTLVSGLLSFAPFFLWGYAPVNIGSARLPIATLFSSLNILAWYTFIIAYRRAVRGVRRSRPLKLWNAALAFLLAASLGAWGRAALAMLKIDDPFLAAAAVHLFLDLFSNGWAVLGLLGLIYSLTPELAKTISGWEDPLLFLGLPLSFLLGAPVDLVPVDLRTLAGIGGLMAAAGLFLHVKKLWPSLLVSPTWALPLAFLLLAAGMQVAASFAPLARWGEQMGLQIFYLHVLLLGFVTLTLFALGEAQWAGGYAYRPEGASARASIRRWLRTPAPWLGLLVVALVASLLPLTGLWPEALGGRWRLVAAFWLSLGPVLAALFVLGMEFWRLRAQPREPAPAPLNGSNPQGMPTPERAHPRSRVWR